MMLTTFFFGTVMVGAALVAIPLFLLGVILYGLGQGQRRKKLRRPGYILMLTGILLAVGNPVAWRAADGIAEQVAEGDSGARWISYNAPGSGFVWNGVRYAAIADVHVYKDEHGQEWFQAAQPGGGDVLLESKRSTRLRIHQPEDYRDNNVLVELVNPDWVYPLENDAGLDLFHYDYFVYCPENQRWKALAYFAHTDG